MTEGHCDKRMEDTGTRGQSALSRALLHRWIPGDERWETKPSVPTQGKEDKEQGKESKEQGKESKEQGKESKEQGKEDKEQGKENKERGKESKEQGKEMLGKKDKMQEAPYQPPESQSDCDIQAVIVLD